MRLNQDARTGTGLVIRAKHIPFQGDPDLKRTVNRMASCGSTLAGWITSADPVRITPLERRVLASLQK